MTGKRLFLLRHAKSSWSDPKLADFDRPLNRRGREAAGRIAAHLAALEIRPDLILCSPAVRTRETLAPILAATGWQVPVRFEREIYDAGLAHLLARLAALPEEIGSVLLVGHNPGLQELALLLARKGPVAARERMARKFPTGGFAEIALGSDTWRAVGISDGRLCRFDVPRGLRHQT